MFFSKLSIFFFFFFLVPLICATNPLLHTCFSQENFTANSLYSSNLNALLSHLSHKAPLTGFRRGSVGHDLDRVNGLALCRGDVSSADCKTCLNDARKELQKHCPNQKGSIIWYDYCLLKYSNSNFFGQIDRTNKFYMHNIIEADDGKNFNENVRTLLGGLAMVIGGSENLYATGQLQLDPSRKLYGLVQCTRDLSNVDCRTCIDNAINELPLCCNAKIGGRVVGGSCNFRYELAPFVHSED